MRRLLILISTVALFALGVTGAGASGEPTGNTGPRATAHVSGKKKIRCQKGYVKKRKHGRFVCVKKKPPIKFIPHPDLDVAGTPGTYKGTNGVTVTSSRNAENVRQITVTITFPTGYVSCGGKPPYPSVTIKVLNMLVSDSGSFFGVSSSGGANVSIQGHFTGPNTLTLDNAGGSNIKAHGQTCAAQYSNASVVF
ncbi:MAG: hypothetical protein ACSLFI_04055 [Solirubrobacterales bacterium]